MRIAYLLFPLLLIGCSDSAPESHNGLSAEWSENANGSRSALLIKRNGIIIAEVAAVSNAFFVETKGSDGIVDLSVSYYGDASEDAATPETFTRIIQRGNDEPARIIFYGSDGMIEKIDDGNNKSGAQQNAAEQPATRPQSKSK